MSLKGEKDILKKRNPIQRNSFTLFTSIFLVPEVSGRDLGDIRSWTAYRKYVVFKFYLKKWFTLFLILGILGGCEVLVEIRFAFGSCVELEIGW